MLTKIKIIDLTVHDIHFPTSHANITHSAAYVTLYTNEPNLKGYGLTFTITSKKEQCVAAIRALKPLLVGRELSSLTVNMGLFWQTMTEMSSGYPHKEAMYLAQAVVANAVWDLWARREYKPLWRLIVDMSPEELVHSLNFDGVIDVISPSEAFNILRNNALTRSERIAELLRKGYPAYNISADLVKYIDSRRLGSVNEILTNLLKATKFNIPVCPRDVGMGLCEYVQHLAMVDYIYISGSLENRVLEYVDHLHEHFTAPAMIRNGHYQVPTAPGYSIKIKDNSLLNQMD